MRTAPFVDSRKDSTGVTRTYKTVQLKDGNIWLAENFDYFLNDHVCQSFRGYRMDDESSRSIGDSGIYYDWAAFAPDLSLIPAGWHLPTVDEWQAMIACYGGTDNAYEDLAKGGSSGLELRMDGGTFFPGEGCQQLAMQGFAYFWTASEGEDKKFAALFECDSNKKKIENKYLRKQYRFNIRLVKDK